MHTDEKMPVGSANYPAGHTDAAIVPPAGAAVALTDKEVATLQVAFALWGHSLHRHAGADASRGLYAERWGRIWGHPRPMTPSSSWSRLGQPMNEAVELFRDAIGTAGLAPPDHLNLAASTDSAPVAGETAGSPFTATRTSPPGAMRIRAER